VLGPDVGNGSPSQLATFRNNSGNLTFPLLQLCGDGVGDTNLVIPYNQRDNYVVINKQGIIRYHADDSWDYGNRYHVNELRAVIDSLVLNPADVDDPRALDFALSSTPSPFTNLTTIEFSNPGPAERHARVTVHDLAGRLIATLYDAPAARGVSRAVWNGRSETGAMMQPGLYLVRAEVGESRLTTRVFLVR
jgi:hypothetical protein